MRKMTVFKTESGALIYAKCHDFDKGIITHYTTDEKFRLYHYLRKETPSVCILFDTRQELEASLAREKYKV